jgi:hypothetical protein
MGMEYARGLPGVVSLIQGGLRQALCLSSLIWIPNGDFILKARVFLGHFFKP